MLVTKHFMREMHMQVLSLNGKMCTFKSPIIECSCLNLLNCTLAIVRGSGRPTVKTDEQQ